MAQEKEVLAFINYLQIWRHHILGSKFVVKIDNLVVSHFLSHPKLTAKQAIWQEFLVEFHFHFEHKVGCTNQVADALSRKVDLAALRILVTISTSYIATSVRVRIKENLD